MHRRSVTSSHIFLDSLYEKLGFCVPDLIQVWFSYPNDYVWHQNHVSKTILCIWKSPEFNRGTTSQNQSIQTHRWDVLLLWWTSSELHPETTSIIKTPPAVPFPKTKRARPFQPRCSTPASGNLWIYMTGFGIGYQTHHMAPKSVAGTHINVSTTFYLIILFYFFLVPGRNRLPTP